MESVECSLCFVFGTVYEWRLCTLHSLQTGSDNCHRKSLLKWARNVSRMSIHKLSEMTPLLDNLGLHKAEQNCH